MEKEFNKREYNLLCANFLEWEQKATFDTKENIWRFNWVDKEGVKHNNLAFDSDWNWIMKVVKKIESLDFRFEIARNSIDFYDIKIENGNFYNRFSTAINIKNTNGIINQNLSKKEVVVLAIWEFLNWYNENK